MLSAHPVRRTSCSRRRGRPIATRGHIEQRGLHHEQHTLDSAARQQESFEVVSASRKLCGLLCAILAIVGGAGAVCLLAMCRDVDGKSSAQSYFSSLACWFSEPPTACIENCMKACRDFEEIVPGSARSSLLTLRRTSPHRGHQVASSSEDVVLSNQPSTLDDEHQTSRG